MPEDKEQLKPFNPCDFAKCQHFKEWKINIPAELPASFTPLVGRAFIYCITCSKFKGNDNYKGKD